MNNFQHEEDLNASMEKAKNKFPHKCSHVGPESAGEVPSVEVFIKDPSPYFREFGENHKKY